MKLLQKRMLAMVLTLLMVLNLLPLQIYAHNNIENALYYDNLIYEEDLEQGETLEIDDNENDSEQLEQETDEEEKDDSTLIEEDDKELILDKDYYEKVDNVNDTQNFIDDTKINEIIELTESLSLLPQFTNASDPKDFIDPWSVMTMSAYGKADQLIEKHLFLVNSIKMAQSSPNSATLAISLTSLGYDATNFHVGNGKSIDLIEAIYNQQSLGGINNYIFALKAYDSGNYKVPSNASFTREVIIEYIISDQNDDGGWSYAPEFGTDYDLTAMAISALLPYKEKSEVKDSIDRAVAMLSSSYKADGGYYSWGHKNSSSASMVIVALSGLGINAHTDDRFIIDDISLLDHLLTFKSDDNGFGYTDNKYDEFSTEQAFRALVSYTKFIDNGEKPYNIYYFGENRIPQPPTESLSKEISVGGTDNIIEGFIDTESNAVLNFQTTTDADSQIAKFPQVSVSKFVNNARSASLEIEKDTVVTSADNWDGVFQLPSIVQNPTIPVDHISHLAIKVGSDTTSLTFDKPVRILLPDMKGKEIGFIDQSGELHEIKNILNEDKIDSLGTYTEGKIEVGNDVAVWTNHLTTFVAYSNIDNEPTTPPGPQDPTKPEEPLDPEEPNLEPEDNTISVSMSITGDANMGTIFNQRVEIEDNSTVFDLLMKVSNEHGISVSYAGNNNSAYVRGINGLYEFDKGPLSGWMYRVNGMLPNVGAGSNYVNDGDNISWYYTYDFTLEDVNFPIPVKPPTDEVIKPVDNSYIDIINEEYINPITSTVEISTILEQMLNNYASKTDISDWEAFSIVLTGDELSQVKKQELIERVVSTNGDFRLTTDAARTALLLQLAGVDITDIEGINLLEKIYNNEDMGRQGLNGYIFSLMVMTNGDIPNDALMTTDMVVETIISYQKPDGGFPLTLGGESNLDITAMAMTALAPYNGETKVQQSLDKALKYLVDNQEEDGTFISFNQKSSETISQVIIALTSNGINPDHQIFVKNNKTLMEVLLTYETSNGRFAHVPGGPSNEMATEQAMQALISYNRFFANEKPIYILDRDTQTTNNETNNIVDNITVELEANENNFIDMDEVSVWAIDYVNKAIDLELIAGDGNNRINPKENITRAEFVKLLLEVMGETPEEEFNGIFNDVDMHHWYAPYVERASILGIVNGTGNGDFLPEQNITRQDMAVIIANAFNLTGEPQHISDADQVSVYAINAVNVVIYNGLMLGVGDNYFNPGDTVTREMAITIIVRILENM